MFCFVPIKQLPPGGIDETSKAVILMGLGIILALFILLISLGLGIGGLIQKERKKIFSVLGVVFSFFILLVLSFIIIPPFVFE